MVVGRIPSSWAKPKYLGEALVVGQGLVRGYSSVTKSQNVPRKIQPEEHWRHENWIPTTMTTRNWDCLRDFENSWIESFTVSGLLSSILTNLQASSLLGSPSDMGFFLVRGYQWDQVLPKCSKACLAEGTLLHEWDEGPYPAEEEHMSGLDNFNKSRNVDYTLGIFDFM